MARSDNLLARATRTVPLPELALLGLLGLLLLAGTAIAANDLIPPRIQLDFTAYYLAAQAVVAGRSPYDLAVLRELAAAQGSPSVVAYLYPPAFAVLLAPLAALPLGAANLVWFALQLLWLPLAALCIVRLVPLPGRALGVLCAMALLMPAVHHTLELGQVNLLLLLLLALALFVLGPRPRGVIWELLGGALLAGATLLKLFPAVLVLPLLAYRRWVALLGFGAGLLLLLLVGLAAGGPATTLFWAADVLPRYAGGFGTPNNQSLVAALGRLFTPTSVDLLPLLGRPARQTLAPLFDSPPLGLLLGYGLSGAVVLASGWLLVQRWLHRGRALEPAEPAFLLVALLLALPLVWYHYYTLLLLPYAVVVPAARRDRAIRLLALLSAVLIAAQRFWRATGQLGTPLLVSLGTAGVALLWLAFWRVLAPRASAGRVERDVVGAERNTHKDRRAAARRRFELQRAPELGHPLAYAEQP